MTQQISGQAHWRGSDKTKDLVRKQIADRWGEEEAKKYDPTKNCFTFQTWWKLGYVVKKGETALRSYTVVEEQVTSSEDSKEQVVEKHMKNVYLFYYLQVEKRLNPQLDTA